MNFLDQIMKGAQDAIDPRTLTTFVIALAIITFYVRSDLPGAQPIRNFVGLQ